MNAMIRNASLAATVALGLGWVGSASAAVETINLDIDHCSDGGCLNGDSGSVKVNDAGGNLAFDVKLTGDLVFQFSTSHSAFNFNLDKSPISLIGSLPMGFTLLSTTAGANSEDGFGKFKYSLDYSGLRTVQELMFTVSAAGGLTLADLIPSVLPPGNELLGAVCSGRLFQQPRALLRQR